VVQLVAGTIRRYVPIVIVALIAGMVGANTLAVAHDADGGGHDSFAHRAGKVTKVVVRRSAVQSVPVGFSTNTEVKCPAGYFAIGGGAVGSVQGVAIVSSYPSDGTGTFDAGHRAWTVQVDNTSSTDRTWRAYVGCVPAASKGSNYSAGVDPVA
jgi:hypothetical protein